MLTSHVNKSIKIFTVPCLAMKASTGVKHDLLEDNGKTSSIRGQEVVAQRRKRACIMALAHSTRNI